MNIRQLRDLAIKIVGLMCVSQAAFLFVQLPGLLMAAWSFHGLLWIAGFAFFMLFYAAFAYVLLVQSRAVAGLLWPEDEIVTGPDFTLSLEACIALVGVYFIPNALSRIAGDVLAMAVLPEGVSWYQRWGGFIPQSVLLAIAVLCIVKSKAIAAYVRKYAE